MPRTAKNKSVEVSENNPKGAVTVTFESKYKWFERQVKKFGMSKKNFIIAACENYVKTHKPLLEG